MSRAKFAALETAIAKLMGETPALAAFAEWPAEAPQAECMAQTIPAIPLVTALSAPVSPVTSAIVNAIKSAAADAHWQQTYSEAEVGRDFLNRYGWFELLGPAGVFRSDSLRAYIAYWGENLNYGWHHHEAEELYYILAGTAEFHAEGLPSAMLRPGGLRHHITDQPHAMDTHAEPVLALVLWRGPGLAGVPRMSGAG
jgi:hypothetical protein